MKLGALVVVHLVNPSEKYWGRLEALDAPGVTVRGINLASYEDWLATLVGEDPAFGAATLFFPLTRVERISLDEPGGSVESLAQACERRTGRRPETLFSGTDRA